MPHNSSIAWRKFGNAVLVVHAKSFSQTDWEEFIRDDWTQYPHIGMLVFPHGGRLNAAQRTEMEAVLKRSVKKTAVVTDSKITRGIVTALRWFNVPIAAFAPAQLAKALAFVGLHPAVEPEVMQEVAQMHRELTLAPDWTVSAQR